MGEPDTAPMGVEEIAEAAAAFKVQVRVSAYMRDSYLWASRYGERLLAAATRGAGLRELLQLAANHGFLKGSMRKPGDGDRILAGVAVGAEIADDLMARHAALSQPTPAPSPDAGVLDGPIRPELLKAGVFDGKKVDGGSADDFVHLRQKAGEEIEGAASVHCSVRKRALRKLIDAYDLVLRLPRPPPPVAAEPAPDTEARADFMARCDQYAGDPRSHSELKAEALSEIVAAEPAPQAEGAADEWGDPIPYAWDGGRFGITKDAILASKWASQNANIGGITPLYQLTALSAPAADAGTRELREALSQIERMALTAYKTGNAAPMKATMRKVYDRAHGALRPDEATPGAADIHTAHRRAALTRAGGEKGE